jgi:NTP pyrophosphatase (non-canonical NTP hydrolase)
VKPSGIWWGEDEAAIAYRLLHTPKCECHCEECERITQRLEQYLGLIEGCNGVHQEYDRARAIRRTAVERSWMTRNPECVIGPRTVTPPRSPAATMLAEFHGALGDARGRGNALLRKRLHGEEHAELLEALTALDGLEELAQKSGHPLTAHREAVARELGDVVYLAYGTAHALALDLDAAVAEIHRANMTKVEAGRTRGDGKLLKFPGFVPPSMAEAVEAVGPQSSTSSELLAAVPPTAQGGPSPHTRVSSSLGVEVDGAA